MSKSEKPSSNRKKVFSVRADADQVSLANFYGIDVGVLFRQCLADALAKKQGKCPTCGQKLKWEKVK